MTRIYALRRKGTAKMRYIPASNPREAEVLAEIAEARETKNRGSWHVFKTSFRPDHWEKEKHIYMDIYKQAARKMFEEEINEE